MKVITLLLLITMLSMVIYLSYSSDLTKERIITSAKREFLDKGYLNASLRDISSNANATTGAIYNHFKGKDGLFESIVGDFANKLLALFQQVHDEVVDEYDFDSAETNDGIGKGMFQVLDFLYSNFELSKLLFCCSVGTKYEKLIDEMIEIEEAASLRVLETENFKLTKINKFFVHVMATSGINNMFEAINHDLTRSEAFEYIGKIQKFYYEGSKALIP